MPKHRAGFKGVGQTGQLPRGLHKNSKNYYLRKHKILFETTGAVSAMKPEATAILSYYYNCKCM